MKKRLHLLRDAQFAVPVLWRATESSKYLHATTTDTTNCLNLVNQKCTCCTYWMRYNVLLLQILGGLTLGFDIGQSDYIRQTNHKVNILVGATESGKNTLINGWMVVTYWVSNGIPFRFKFVRERVHEDESATRNQTHSQTSSGTPSWRDERSLCHYVDRHTRIRRYESSLKK